MKINEVEQIVGITKKNIRFYEEQGLISPARNSANGYRDYGEADVDRLMKVKLFRRLGISIEEIRNLLDGQFSIRELMERHEVVLAHEERSLELTKGMCQHLSDAVGNLEELDAAAYLAKMEELEMGGRHFMKVEDIDVIHEKKKNGAKIAAAVMAILLLCYDGLIFWANSQDPIPTVILAILVVIPTLAIVGIVMALNERIKEIEGGEEDEASKY